jgi:hypothetical protein
MFPKNTIETLNVGLDIEGFNAYLKNTHPNSPK